MTASVNHKNFTGEAIVLFVAILFFYNCNNTGGGRISWTEADRTQMTNNCIQAASPTMGPEKAKNYCNCMQQKMEIRFPDPKDAAKVDDKAMNSEEMQAMVRTCLRIDTNKTVPWTQEQFGKYLQACSIAQQQQGMTEEQSVTYCGCMARKVALKFSYEVASKMTPGDFQTEEWKTAANECKTIAMQKK